MKFLPGTSETGRRATFALVHWVWVLAGFVLAGAVAAGVDFFFPGFREGFPGRVLAPGAGVLFFVCWSGVVSFLHFHPVGRIARAIEQVIQGDYATKVRLGGSRQWEHLGNRFNQMVRIFRKKIAVEKYVSRSTAQMVESLKTGEFSTAPHRQEVSIFFSDIRGFTRYAEQSDSFDVVTTVNEIFNIQVDQIQRFDGDIDKFVGDAVMAVFPNPGQAFRAAWEIQKRMGVFNSGREEVLSLGIGLHHGTGVVGAVGGRDSLDWTVMGDVVNTASRLSASCPGGCIFVSGEAHGKMRTRRTGRATTLHLKGRRNSQEVFVFGEEFCPGGESCAKGES
ncbi:Adenylate cyclase, class 3 [Alkalispirochaeta americana]|uniref:Adenylate cyclase, class 3 n=1 Tax=Alkalispirochaeta americana TaxID=159291 RepID=A0A1N6N791_9SPIO|nr:adenylate/guanylate cyclase domain-containing protein [Alkalispirochaeta americana]SIP87916.1 Adenylate cyclase, class 3 [Alkalispirochaeta americana]